MLSLGRSSALVLFFSFSLVPFFLLLSSPHLHNCGVIDCDFEFWEIMGGMDVTRANKHAPDMTIDLCAGQHMLGPQGKYTQERDVGGTPILFLFSVFPSVPSPSFFVRFWLLNVFAPITTTALICTIDMPMLARVSSVASSF